MKYENLKNINPMSIYLKTKDVALTQKATALEFNLNEYSFRLKTLNELEEKLASSTDTVEKFFYSDQIKITSIRVAELEKEMDSLIEELGGVL